MELNLDKIINIFAGQNALIKYISYIAAFFCFIVTTSLKTRAYKHITPHANGEPLFKQSSPYSLLSSSTMILLVWSANGDVPFQGKFQVNLLIEPMELSMSSNGQIE